jgi:hypothetical protein
MITRCGCRPPWSLPNSSSPSASSPYGSGSGREPLLYDPDNGWILDAGLGWEYEYDEWIEEAEGRLERLREELRRGVFVFTIRGDRKNKKIGTAAQSRWE